MAVDVVHSIGCLARRSRSAALSVALVVPSQIGRRSDVRGVRWIAPQSHGSRSAAAVRERGRRPWGSACAHTGHLTIRTPERRLARRAAHLCACRRSSPNSVTISLRVTFLRSRAGRWPLLAHVRRTNAESQAHIPFTSFFPNRPPGRSDDRMSVFGEWFMRVGNY